MTEPNAPRLEAPRADYQGSWTELTGYVTQACDDGEAINPEDLLVYMRELKHRALAPIREWMNGMASRDGA